MYRNLLFNIVIACATVIICIAGEYGKPTIMGASTESYRGISGLVLPHHDLAREMIIETVKMLAEVKPDIQYIVVLSPNHYRPLGETFTSAINLKDFLMATEQINKLKVVYPGLVLDEKLLNGEHGLYIPMNYLAHYYPHAGFIPIAISPYYTTEKLKRMAEMLTKILPSQTLFVASTDFSHKQMQSEAYQSDQQTIKAIKEFDFQRLSGFGDDNLDSPAAMSTVMYIMQLLGATAWNTWQESHGAILTGNPRFSGTSYVSGVFTLPVAPD